MLIMEPRGHRDNGRNRKTKNTRYRRHETTYLFQRISIAIQRSIADSFCESFLITMKVYTNHSILIYNYCQISGFALSGDKNVTSTKEFQEKSSTSFMLIFKVFGITSNFKSAFHVFFK